MLFEIIEKAKWEKYSKLVFFCLEKNHNHLKKERQKRSRRTEDFFAWERNSINQRKTESPDFDHKNNKITTPLLSKETTDIILAQYANHNCFFFIFLTLLVTHKLSPRRQNASECSKWTNRSWELADTRPDSHLLINKSLLFLFVDFNLCVNGFKIS